MPLAFDVNRLKPSSYDLTQSVEMVRLQSTLTDFMTIVRDDQKALDDDQGLLNTFCNFIDDSSIWEHAYQVIPELHSSQYRDTSGPGPIDHILRELNYRLDPWPQNEEEELAQFKEFEQNQIRSDVRYIMTLGTGKATQNEKDEIDAMVEYQMLLRYLDEANTEEYEKKVEELAEKMKKARIEESNVKVDDLKQDNDLAFN